MNGLNLVDAGNLMPFLITLAIAAVVVWLNNRFGTRGTRAFMDRAANRSVDHGDAAARIAQMGQKDAPRHSLDRTIYPASKGVRLLGTGLTIGLLVFLWRNPYFFVGPAHDLTIYTLFCLLGLWYTAYLWAYEIEVQDNRISIPTYWFKPRMFELSGLESIEEDGSYGYRLVFSNGRKVLVLKHVDGQAKLTEILESHAAPAYARASRS